MNLSSMFRVIGIALFIQLALGGLVTFNFISPFIHLVWGIVLGVLAVVAIVFVVRTPSKPRQLVGLSIGIGVDILLQGLLGFAILATNSDVISWVHFLNALAIFGMTLFGTFLAMRASSVASGATPSANS